MGRRDALVRQAHARGRIVDCGTPGAAARERASRTALRLRALPRTG